MHRWLKGRWPSAGTVLAAVCGASGCMLFCPPVPWQSERTEFCVTNVVATPAATRADGTPWDEDGTGPDLAVVWSPTPPDPWVENTQAEVCAASAEALAAMELFVRVVDHDPLTMVELLPPTQIPVTASDVDAGRVEWQGTGAVRALSFRFTPYGSRTQVALAPALYADSPDGGPFTRAGRPGQPRVDARCQAQDGALYGSGPADLSKIGVTPLCTLVDGATAVSIHLSMDMRDDEEPLASWRAVHLPLDGINSGMAVVPGWDGITQLDVVIGKRRWPTYTCE